MKKFLSIALTVLLVAALSVPMFAGFSEHANAASGTITFDVPKIQTAWAADGTFTPGEYYDIAIDDSWLSAAWALDEDEAEIYALNPEMAMSWDESYVYLYVKYTSNKYAYQNAWDDDPGSMWYSGALQISFAEATAADGDTDRLEYGIGKSTNTGALLSTIWNDWSGNAHDYVASGDFGVFPNGNTVVFESRTPYAEFSKTAPAEGVKYRYNLVISFGNDQNYAHWQLGEGCTGDPGKNAGLFPTINLVAATPLAVETEAPAADTAAAAADTAAPAAAATTTTAAQTSDNAALIVLLAVVALGTAAVATKKHYN
jgi:hypothetical protein